MYDQLIRVGAIGMLSIGGYIGYSLFVGAESSTGPDFEMPQTALTLDVIDDDEAEAAERALALPAGPQEQGGPAALSNPSVELAQNSSTDGAGIAVPGSDVEVPQFSTAALDGALGTEANDDAIPSITGVEMTASDILPIDDCEPLMRLDPEANAMLRVLISAPCNGGERVEISHEALQFAVTIDSDGGFITTVPALMEEASVTISFADGGFMSETITAEGVNDVRRFAVIGETIMDLELHALEAGAEYGTPGHVHPGNPGASMVVLGDASAEAPLFSQVYTAQASAGVDDLGPISIEAVVTNDNCGLDRSATAVMANGGTIIEMPIEVAMPNCDSVDDLVVLKDVFWWDAAS